MCEDFDQMLAEIGMTEEEMTALTNIQSDRIDVLNSTTFHIDDSPIHGKGVFASRFTPAESIIGPVRIGLNRTVLGYTTNHSRFPNAFTRPTENGGCELVAIHDIQEGEEITINYREAIVTAAHAESTNLMTPALQCSWAWLVKAVDGGGSREEIRAAIEAIEHDLLEMPQADHGLQHLFLDGLYIRVAHIQKGTLFVTPAYKEECILTTLYGRMVIVTEDGAAAVTSPTYLKTTVGTKRVIFAIDEVMAHTVHPNPTNEKNINILESRIYEQTPTLGGEK